MNNNHMQWYLIYTRPNQEIIAKKNLENQKFNIFLPIIRSSSSNQDTKKLDEPMFPRYLFVELNIKEDHWIPIKSSKGVSHFINFNNGPISIPKTVIESLRSVCDEEGIYYQRNIKRDYQQGEKLIIKEGLLKGLEGIFLSKSSHQRVRLLLKTLNQNFIADVPTIDVGKKKIQQQINIK